MKLPAALILLTQAVNTAGYGAGNCKNPTQWDAIVVGAGLSGSIVAAKLSENEPDKCILVVEGGKESGQIKNASEASIPTSKGRFFEDHWNIVAENETPFNSPATYDYLVDYSRNAEYIWGGEDGSGTPGRLIVGKVVGGSGAINGAMMQYPPESQWDAYPDGWKAWDMKNYLDEIHNVMNATSYPSTDGEHYHDELGPNQVKKAMKDYHKFVEYEDAAYWKPFGSTMGIPRVSTVSGRRSSSTAMYLKPALEKNPNIQLWTETDVVKIELDDTNTRATGLSVKREGAVQNIALKDDGLLVVCGGGVKTPQLLLQSGIGPGLKVNNKYVGESLSDKSITWIQFKVPGIEPYDKKSPPQEDQSLYANDGAGPLAQFGPLLVGMIDIEPEITGDKPNDKHHNVVEFFVSSSVEKDVIRVHLVHLTPKKGRGKIHLDNDGNAVFNGAAQFDWGYSGQSFKAAIDIVKNAMEDKGYIQIESGANGHPALNPMNHPGGTCELDKCIDRATMIVKNLSNVAVCDNSIIPEQAKVHTALSLMGIALRASELLKKFWVNKLDSYPEQKDEL